MISDTLPSRQVNSTDMNWGEGATFRDRSASSYDLVTDKKAPAEAGAFVLLKFSRDQYFATTGPQK